MEKLFPYQEAGVDWLSQKKVALLADDMGLGKSAQAIRACDRLNAKRICVVCPAVVRPNWLKEFQKFSLAGMDGGRSPFFIAEKRTVPPPPDYSVITSYDLASHYDWSSHSFDVLILDEAHYLKSHDAKRTKHIFGKNGICHRSRRTWALTGTPMPNHAGELWTLLYVFGATAKKYYDFIGHFCEFAPGGRPGQGPIQITGTRGDRIPELKTILAPIMLRRRKEDVLTELPPIMFADLIVEPGPVDLELSPTFFKYVWPADKSRQLFAEVARQERLLQDTLDGAGVEMRTMSGPGMKILEALATSVATLRRYTGMQKVASVVQMVTEELKAKAYEKVVIFAIHVDVIEWLRRSLSEFNPVTLYGKTPPKKREQNIVKFQTNQYCRVFIGNILAAGTGITLTAAHQVIFIEQDWVPGNNAQAAMRCHRIGQTKMVSVRFAGLANSIDEKVACVLRRKTRDIVAVFDGGVVMQRKDYEKSRRTLDRNLENNHRSSTGLGEDDSEVDPFS